MEPKTEAKALKDLVVNVENKSGVPQDTIDAAKNAMQVVWRNLIKTEQNMTLQFVDFIVDDTGKIINSAAMFTPELNKIVIAVKSDSFKSFTNVGFGQEAVACLLTGHEMGHKVQDFRGEKLKSNTDFDSVDYKNDPQEAEAWDIALHTFKKIYPNSSGKGQYADKILEIPKKSKFD